MRLKNPLRFIVSSVCYISVTVVANQFLPDRYALLAPVVGFFVGWVLELIILRFISADDKESND
jgi:hypothetical protein